MTISEKQALDALRFIQADIEAGKPAEDYKRMFAAFIDSVEVFESYVTIALNILRMIGARTPIAYMVESTRPLLEINQIVVWNGGGEGSFAPTLSTVYFPLRNAHKPLFHAGLRRFFLFRLLLPSTRFLAKTCKNRVRL